MTAGGPPSIAGLQLVPNVVTQGSGDEEATIDVLFRFSDSDGDASKYAVTVADGSGAEVATETGNCSTSGAKTGTTTVQLRVPTANPGTYTIRVRVTDLLGLVSNTIDGMLEVKKAASGPAWTTGSPEPTPRGESAAGVIDGKLYVVGGSTGGGGKVDNAVPVSVLECYDPETDTWTARSPMPTPRMGLAAAVADGKLYTMGGTTLASDDGCLTALTTVEAYDPRTDTWTTRSSMPEAKAGFGAATIDGRIYAFGGGNAAPHALVYDPATDTWSQPPWGEWYRNSPGVSAVGERLYAVGGWWGSAVRDLIQYDPATDTWSWKSPMKAARWYLTSSVSNGLLYAIGGGTDTEQPDPFAEAFTNVDTVECYNPVTDTWSTKTPMPGPRAGMVSGSIGGRIYLVGGYDEYPEKGPPNGRLEIYDPLADP